MPTFDKHPAGNFVWFELATTDPSAAKEFYSSLLGWEAQDIDGHDVAAVIEGLTLAGSARRPTVLINRTSTAHGLRCLPPDADGHFIKLPPELAARAEAELTAELERLHG